MRCLTECAGDTHVPSVSGRCWLETDYTFLRANLCDAAASGGAGQGGTSGTGGIAGSNPEGGGESPVAGDAGSAPQGGVESNGGSGGSVGAGAGSGGNAGSGLGGSAGDGSEGGQSGGGGTAGSVNCNGDERRCSDGELDHCADGSWTNLEQCPGACHDATSCACQSGDANRCLGDTPQVCRPEGFWEDAVTCDGFCSGGQCCETHCQILSCDLLLGCTCYGPYTVCAPAEPRCLKGDRRCQGNVAQRCDDQRTWQIDETCPFVCTGQGECTGACSPASTRCKPGSVDIPQTCDAEGKYVDQEACYYACVEGECGGSCKPGKSQCSDALTAETCDASGEYAAGVSCPFGCYDGACSSLPDTCGAAESAIDQFSESFEGYSTGALQDVADAIWIRSGSSGRGSVMTYSPHSGSNALDLDRQFDSDGSYYRKLLALPATPRKVTIGLYATISSDFGPDPGLDFGLAKINSKFSISKALTVRFNEHNVSVIVGDGSSELLSSELDYASSGFTYLQMEFDFCVPALKVYVSKSTPAAATLLGSLPIPAQPAFDAFYMNGTWWAYSVLDDISVSAED